jgi:PAS domain-containing protein
MQDIFDNAAFMRYALDAIPSIVLVTDEDVRILYRNQAARELLKGDRIYGSRIGEVMHCIHSEDVPAGCGNGPRCADCVVRNSVSDSFAGKTVRRRPTEISIKTAEKTLEVQALVSVSGFSFEGKIYALMVIEDISELSELRSLLPICASCHKIRTPDNHWEKVETYIKRHDPSVKLTHGLCPDCARKYYPDHSD